jgi:membrane-associated protease RseP (regulator of RpoE activity)
MRRLHALLLTAGLFAAPISAVAGPTTPPTTHVETFSFSTSRGRLGVTVLGITPELRTHLGASSDRGVLVARVEPDSPAALAGIAVGDVLLEVHGRAVDSAGDVLAACARVGKGQPVEIQVLRDRKLVTLTATLAEAPRPTVFDHPHMRELMKQHPSLLREFFDDSWFDHERWDLPRPTPPRQLPRSKKIQSSTIRA